MTTPAASPDVRIHGASWRAVYIIWYRDVVRYWRDRSRLAASLAQPILFLVVFGTGLGSALGGGLSAGGRAPGHRLSYITFIYPGIIGMAVLFTSIFSAMSIVWDREFGFLREVMIAPINRGAIAVGKVLGGATQAMVQGLLLLILAPVVGVGLTPLSVLELIPLVFVLAFSLTALGVTVAARMRSMQGFQGVMNFLMMPMFFLAGALFPLQGLPGWMTVLTRLDPAAYGVDPIRRTVLAGAGVPDQVVNSLGLTLFGSVLSVPVEAAITLGFGLLLLTVAVRSFQRTD
ncbi:MAG: ABC transporter permease [Candidatus Dormibacteria bacterium]